MPFDADRTTRPPGPDRVPPGAAMAERELRRLVLAMAGVVLALAALGALLLA